eukprot:UN01283
MTYGMAVRKLVARNMKLCATSSREYSHGKKVISPNFFIVKEVGLKPSIMPEIFRNLNQKTQNFEIVNYLGHLPN